MAIFRLLEQAAEYVSDIECYAIVREMICIIVIQGLVTCVFESDGQSALLICAEPIKYGYQGTPVRPCDFVLDQGVWIIVIVYIKFDLRFIYAY